MKNLQCVINVTTVAKYYKKGACWDNTKIGRWQWQKSGIQGGEKLK